MIKCLSEEVQASLRSGVAITSLGQCVEELVFNSIDAKATCVAIRVDLETFKIQVVDNGSGMGREDLQTVGNRYFTSKCYSVEDLENLTFYGFRGEALASITSIASIVEISSKTSKIAKTFLKVFHNGKGLEVSEAELNRPSTGTTVTVYNLFHQLPVRRKCMDSILEFERVRHKVEALSLMHPSVSFSLRNDASCSTVLQLPKTKDVCSRFSQIYGLGKSQKLREIYHKSGGFEISGYISSQGHYNKSIQFLYVNRRQVLKTRVHKLIDFLLRKQSTICKTKPLPVTSSPAHHRSGSELNGVFVINVKCQHDEYDVCLEPAKTLIEFRSWDALLLCIEEGVKAFLKREHLFIEPCGEDVKEFNENNGFCLSSAMAFQPSLPEEKHMQENFRRACDNIVDSYEMFNLQSKSVRRKITLEKETSDHTGPTNNVKETAALPDLTITEPVCESSSKVKNPLPNKKDTTRDLPKLSNLHKEPNVCDDPQTEVVNSKCPQEGCGQSLSYALEKDSSLCSEMCVKDAKCLHGPAFQEGSPSSATLGPTENVRDVNACKHPFLLKRALVGKYGNAKEGKRPPTGLNSHGEAAVREESLKLSSTGLIVHLMQHQPPDKTADINHSVNIPPILGPVSARDIFDKNLRFSGQTSSTQKYLRMTKGSVYTGNAHECMEIGNVCDQKEEMNSLPAVGSGGDFVTPNIKELISIVPSSSVHNVDNATSKKQMAKNLTRFRHCTFTKLSLHPKLGSLESFRQHYGSIKNTQSRTTKNVDEFAVPACVGSLTDTNKNLEHSSNCEIPVGSNNNVGCNNNGHDCPPPLEESQLSTEEHVLSTYVRESPLTLTDYSQSRTEAPISRFTGTLASKVSRMKGSLKETVSLEPRGQPSEQSQVHSSPKNEGRCGLLSQNNILQRDDPISQFSAREEGTKSHSFTPYSPEQGNPMEISNTKAVDTEDTVSLCFIDSDGEYVVSQKRSLVMDNKEVRSEDTCEDTSTMDRTSKQSMNTCELPIEGLSSTSEAATDGGGLAQNEESQFHPSEWIHQFDASLGRTVYINRMTGLSTYCTPPSEEPKAICTKDISTMAVNVMENGFQCRCHPFRSEFIVPFLPRPQKERHLASQDFRDAQGESLQSLFSDWDNPVFARCPEVALDVSSGKADNLAVKIHNILYPYRFTKDMIESMQVLNQVDNKFIACLISTRAGENKEIDGNLLVLVDQHAAHERIRLEQLIIDSYEKQIEASGKKKLLASTVCPPLEIEITEEQRRLLWCCHKSLEDLGLELAFPEDNPLQILVGKVPLCFVEREANELRRGRQTVAKSIVEEFIREQVELLQTARGARGTFPLTILKVLASQACHGAIKFNDGLTLEESCHLMKALSCCQLPFQCAHGRPSMLPLADTDHLQQESQPKPNLAKLRRMAKAWQHFRKEKTPLEKHDPHLSSSTSTTSHLALAPCISSPAPPPLEHKSVRPTWQP